VRVTYTYMIVSLKRQIYILEYLLHSIPDLLLEDT